MLVPRAEHTLHDGLVGTLVRAINLTHPLYGYGRQVALRTANSLSEDGHFMALRHPSGSRECLVSSLIQFAVNVPPITLFPAALVRS